MRLTCVRGQQAWGSPLFTRIVQEERIAFVYRWKEEEVGLPLMKERWWCQVLEAALQCGGSPGLRETRGVKVPRFCEQVVRGACVLRESADARERMRAHSSISSSIILFTVSLI